VDEMSTDVTSWNMEKWKSLVFCSYKQWRILCI